ncbi:hypothetical protein TNCV_3083671, partial [Trichonephila clavipes]
VLHLGEEKPIVQLCVTIEALGGGDLKVYASRWNCNKPRTKRGKDWSAGDEFAILSRRRHISRDMPASRGFSVVRALPVWTGPQMQGTVRRGCTYGGERARMGIFVSSEWQNTL